MVSPAAAAVSSPHILAPDVRLILEPCTLPASERHTSGVNLVTPFIEMFLCAAGPAMTPRKPTPPMWRSLSPPTVRERDEGEGKGVGREGWMGGGIRRQVPDGRKSYREAGRWRHWIAEGRDIFLDVSTNLSVLLKYCHLGPVLKLGPWSCITKLFL